MDKKELIIKILEENSNDVDNFNSAVFMDNYEDVADTIVKLFYNSDRSIIIDFFEKMTDNDIKECTNGFADRVYDRINKQ